MVPGAEDITTAEIQPEHNPPSSPRKEDNADHDRIAQAVAKLLCPTIMEAVEIALHKSFQSLKMDLTSHVRSKQKREFPLSKMI